MQKRELVCDQLFETSVLTSSRLVKESNGLRNLGIFAERCERIEQGWVTPSEGVLRVYLTRFLTGNGCQPKCAGIPHGAVWPRQMKQFDTDRAEVTIEGLAFP